jgi:hypothetical protein
MDRTTVATLAHARVLLPALDELAAAGPFFGVVDQVEFARRLPFGGEKSRRLGSVLRPMIHDMHEHLQR